MGWSLHTLSIFIRLGPTPEYDHWDVALRESTPEQLGIPQVSGEGAVTELQGNCMEQGSKKLKRSWICPSVFLEGSPHRVFYQILSEGKGYNFRGKKEKLWIQNRILSQLSDIVRLDWKNSTFLLCLDNTKCPHLINAYGGDPGENRTLVIFLNENRSISKSFAKTMNQILKSWKKLRKGGIY